MNTSLKYMCGLGLAITVLMNSAYASQTVGQEVDTYVDHAGTEMKHASKKTERFLDDASITTKIKAEIFKEPLLKSLNINVKTTSGVVTLAGEVGSHEAFDKAGEIAKSISGVKRVKNELSIKSIQ